nr:TetR/AcrR family transcriptional regulator [Paenibacillus sp. YX.27]
MRMPPRAGIGRSAVVEAASKLADERGADQITLAAVAERLGVKQPSLYNHIESPGELKSSLALHGLERLCQSARRWPRSEDVWSRLSPVFYGSGIWRQNKKFMPSAVSAAFCTASHRSKEAEASAFRLKSGQACRWRFAPTCPDCHHN